MKTIWKYELPIGDLWRVMMPGGAKVLSADVGIQNKTLFIWAEVDEVKFKEERGFVIVGTGNPMGDVGRFVATIQDPPFVWHVFEEATK